MAKTKKIERKAEQIAEIKKCGLDPAYFIRTYVKISHPVRGPIKFETYPYQEECIKTFMTHRMVVCNKSRQLGLSTVSAAYCLWMALFRREKNVLVIATKLDTAKLFLEKVAGMFESLPEWLVMPSLTAKSIREMRFSNGSRIKAIPTSLSAGRGEAISCLVIDEAAHIENFDDLWTGLQPTLSTGGDVIVISSPLGVGNQFYNIWKGATSNGEGIVGQNGFFAVELPWTVHPEHDTTWFTAQCAALGDNPRAIGSELLCSFSTSGFSFLDKASLEWLLTTTETPIATYDKNNDVSIWKYPEPGHKYIISADVARADGEDFTAFHIIDATTDEVAGEFRGRIQPDHLAGLLVDLATKYNNAFIVHEMNSSGIATSYKLKELKYKNVYYEKLFKGSIEMAYDPKEAEALVPGFLTTVKTRPDILAKLEVAMRNHKLKCRSHWLAEEFKTFVVTGDKPKAQKNCHDDMIMALAIGVSFLQFANKSNSPYADPLTLILNSSKSSKTVGEMINARPSWASNNNPIGFMPSRDSLNSHRQQTTAPTDPKGNVAFYKKYDWLIR